MMKYLFSLMVCVSLIGFIGCNDGGGKKEPGTKPAAEKTSEKKDATLPPPAHAGTTGGEAN